MRSNDTPKPIRQGLVWQVAGLGQWEGRTGGSAGAPATATTIDSPRRDTTSSINISQPWPLSVVLDTTNPAASGSSPQDDWSRSRSRIERPQVQEAVSRYRRLITSISVSPAS